MEISYSKYNFKFIEKIKYYTFAAGMVIGFAYLFYRNYISIIFLIPIGILYIKKQKKNLLVKTKKEFGIQFKDAILAVSGVLQAGYSVENCFVHAYSEMETIYGEDSYICRELKVIINNINLNISLEDSLSDLANRTKIEDIEIFAEIFIIAKRCGGDLIKIIIKTADEISDKSDIKREIDTVISAKKYEQKIMNFMPLLIILYVDLSSEGLLSPLYNNIFGIVVMTGCLLLYGAAYYLAEKIVQIEV